MNNIHWDKIYTEKASTTVSWYCDHDETSLQLLDEMDLKPQDAIIDVGGGASTWVDDLIGRGFSRISILDLSAAALAVTQQRLGKYPGTVKWIVGDVLETPLPQATFALWHDRAVFHFLTKKKQRQRYVQVLSDGLKPGGHVVISTFAEDGPTQCSELPVCRYSPEQLRSEFGALFTLISHNHVIHRTPAGKNQAFTYCHFQIV